LKILIVALVIVVILLTGCSSVTTTPTTTTTPIITSVIQEREVNSISVSIADLYSNPSSYDGKDITFTGIVLSFVMGTSGESEAMNVRPVDAYLPIIYVDDATIYTEPVKVGDTITIWGTGEGIFTGNNELGGAITLPSIMEFALLDNTTGYRDDQASTTAK